MKAHEWLEWTANDLEAAKREGASEDTPEGARYITLSDTLAKQFAANLRRIANALRGQIDIELG